MELKVAVHIDSYIADPYWPEREKLITIAKQSGLSRARTEQTRRKALDTYLAASGLTRADYQELERLAARPFYLHDGCIIVPELHVMSMIVAACDEIGARDRPCAPGLARTLIRPSPWPTGKTGPDGTWERFAVVSSGTGAKLTNQRALRRNPYIKDAAATGTIEIDAATIRPDVLWKTLSYAGTHVGIGAARKMGWGRFTLTPL
jgi:hypothetical protein